MNRNTPAFGEIDTINTPRSTWNRSWGHKTTFNAGKLIPILFDEDIIPGTTIKHKTKMVIRLTTPKYPTMDNLVFDWYAFRAPKFWYWEHFKEQFGENNLTPWTQTVEYTTPQINVTTAYGPNDVASYMGIPQNITGFQYDRLGLNFYCDIWNNWFRSQALQAPIIIDKGDNTLTSDGTINTGYGLLPVCRKFDLFSACLPEPQKSPTGAVSMPLGTQAPIYGDGKSLSLQATNDIFQIVGGTNSTSNGTLNVSASNISQSNVGVSLAHGSLSGSTALGVITKDKALTRNESSGIYADLTQATASSINALRLAVATQRIFEADARFGSIYRQSLLQYGVFAGSMETLVPEYIGGSSEAINIISSIQTSATSTTPLGETGAYSVTASVNVDFTKSFTTHDMLMIVGCVRVDQHTYQQGLPRQFTRLRRLEHFNPKLSFIGNQPVYNYQIYCTGTTTDNQVFGYQEAWEEYMYKISRVSGMMNSAYSAPIDSWHFGDNYANLPILGATWIEEPITNIDRCLTVSSAVTNQFWADFWFEQTVSAPIPRNRVPGLIDHY